MKIDYEMKVSEDQVFGRCIDADAPKDYVPSLVVLPQDMPSGRYRVRIERIRAPLPPGHEWDGDKIHRVSGPCMPATYEVSCGQVWGLCEDRTPARVHPGVIDAFRAEGLLPPAEAQS